MKRSRPKYKQIIEAAVKVIAENGYHASQVSKIAKEAGVADGTIYLYFKNKEDILVSLFKEKMGQFIKNTVQYLEEKQSADTKLLAFIEMHFRQFATDRSLSVVTQLELRQSKKDLRIEINTILKPYLKVIENIINEGIAEGVFHKDLNIPLVRQMIFGTLDEAVTTWVFKDHKYNLVKQAPTVHRMLTQGLSINPRNVDKM